jgi:hypothetical protein
MRLVIFVFFLLISCKLSLKNLPHQDEILNKIAEKELGANSRVEKNKSNSFGLAYQKNDISTQYIVVRLTDYTIVIKKKIRGTISWNGDMQLKEFLIPGIVKKDAQPDDQTLIIDLNQFVIHSK